MLEPLGGYLLLAEKLAAGQNTAPDPNPYAEAFNFGPQLEATRSVGQLVEEVFQHWPGSWVGGSDQGALHEAGQLHLQIDKAHHQLCWQPRWDFATAVARTVGWYRAVHEEASALDCCLADLALYQQLKPQQISKP